MKNIFTLIVLLLSLTLSARAQVLVQYDFDNYPLTEATVGPDALYINPNTFTNGEGIYILKSSDVMGYDFEIPGYVYDVESLTLRFDYMRQENEANFFRRDGFLLSMRSGRISLQYDTDKANGGTQSYSFSDIYTLPSNQRMSFGFTYDKITGMAQLWVNGNSVWSYDGPNNRSLRFFGGNAYVGELMDGTGSSTPSLFGFESFDIPNVTLPVELLSFTGTKDGSSIMLTWLTATESNNAYFTLERSKDGNEFSPIGTIAGAGNSNSVLTYTFMDDAPEQGVNYYRLKQNDFDGQYSYSEPIVVAYENDLSEALSVFPNPIANGWFVINTASDEGGHLLVQTPDGKIIKEININSMTERVDLSELQGWNGLVILLFTNSRGERSARQVLVTG